ncbi:MAG: methyltransferase domain-containing protein [bacterium]|nr:methyltransferase domain-containing protein [bacterium]
MTDQQPLREVVEKRGKGEVKLHLGCGGERWRDFINVDLFPHDPRMADSSRRGCIADVLGDLRDLGLPDESVDEIFTSHTFEHFTRWEGVAILADWFRMLKPGGRLHIETPDFWRCVLWLFHVSRTNRKLAKQMFYGNQWDGLEYETHRYLWNARELKQTLVNAGFSTVQVDHKTLTHHPGRDMKAIAVK